MTEVQGPPLLDETAAVVAFSGDIDLRNADGIRGAARMARHDGHRSLIVDLSAVEFIDSQGINVLVRAHRELAGDGGTLTIRRPSEPVRAVLVLSGVDSLIPVVD